MGRVRSRVAAVVTTVVLVASGSTALAAIATPLGAATKGTDTVTAYPSPGSQLAPHAPYYEISARPGTSVTQTVHVANHNKHAVDVKIAGLDGYTSDATGAAYTTPNRVATRTGTWIVVSTPELTMQAGEAARRRIHAARAGERAARPVPRRDRAVGTAPGVADDDPRRRPRRFRSDAAG